MYLDGSLGSCCSIAGINWPTWIVGISFIVVVITFQGEVNKVSFLSGDYAFIYFLRFTMVL